LRSRVRAHLRLLRLPNALTAAADVVAGGLLAGVPACSPTLSLAAFGSLALYAGTVAANDLRDIAFDRCHHPERPLARKDVSPTFAKWAAATGLGLGLLSGALGPPLFAVLTAGIGLGILADLLLPKAHAAARAATVSLCRALNLLRGAALLAGAGALPIGPALVHAGWTLSLSLTSEAEDGPRGAARAGALLPLLGMAAAPAAADPRLDASFVLALLLGAATGFHAAWPLLRQRAPSQAVLRAVFAFPLLGATYLLAAGRPLGASLSAGIYAGSRILAAWLRQRTA
jgi:4-hydroxybenzoate polyprenyltransferase